MKYALHLQSRSVQVAADLENAMNAPGEDLAPAALAIARVEYPSLDTGEYLDAIERMGDDAAARVERTGARGQDAIKVLNEYLYDEQRFTGNRQRSGVTEEHRELTVVDSHRDRCRVKPRPKVASGNPLRLGNHGKWIGCGKPLRTVRGSGRRHGSTAC